ncbi:hypothetical protein CRG98_023215 [Punica granatum]|uniref:Peptidase S8/S53 domain-containing protein n=1 Tax=Punica granatum TaxID=22663 RepID=A0A2I0JJH6_PUNGR|nr:hypothetical protein CRG98_023215 [Punica granatum]
MAALMENQNRRNPNSNSDLDREGTEEDVEYDYYFEGDANIFTENDPFDDAFFVAGGDREPKFDEEEETEGQEDTVLPNDGKGEVISIFESRMMQLHTTHSWEFLGVNFQYEGQMPSGSMFDVIVSVIDTRLWPESRSYDDTGLGPVPERFRGECIPGENFTSAHCNRKIIGARYYYKGFETDEGPLESFNQTFFRSGWDGDGHGSHTSSTFAGSVVDDVSLYGLGRGTARRGAPHARLTMYKKGILVSASAGNSFFSRIANNVAPWILTVAASTLDREFTTNIYLENSKIVKGYSLNPFKMGTSYGLIAGGAAAALGIPSKNVNAKQEVVATNTGYGEDREMPDAKAVAMWRV